MPDGHDFLSPKDFGAAIGISESSVKRWVDDGKLLVMRTPGGHRRISLGEAIRFIRVHRCSIQNPVLFGLDPTGLVGGEGPREDLDKSTHAALMAGNECHLRQVLLRAYLDGHSIAALADGPIRNALEQIGLLWAHADEGIAIEHVAVQTMIRVLNRLHTLMPPVPPDAPLALGGGPSGDPYQIPSMLAELTLIEAGWRTVNLGPDCPLGALQAAIARHRPRLVWMSVSGAHREDRPALIAELACLCKRLGIRLAIGGRTAAACFPDVEGAVHCDRTRSLSEFAGMCRALNPLI